MTGKSGDILRWVLTIIVIAVMIWWLYNVWLVQGIAVKKDADGNVLDVYTRARDTLAIVVPLVTLALGYWFGVKGADTAEKNAATANDQAKAATAQAKDATAQAVVAEKQVTALRGELPADAYAAALKKYPDIFTKN